jgi:hypothetical protein
LDQREVGFRILRIIVIGYHTIPEGGNDLPLNRGLNPRQGVELFDCIDDILSEI